MSEPASLQRARMHLAQAEAQFAIAAGLTHLEAGLDLVDQLSEDAGSVRDVANNLAATYATKIFGRVRDALASDRATPQPTLEHYFKLMLAFDQGDFELPDAARALKIAVVRRLVELAYEGHPAETRRKALEQLGDIVDGSGE